MTTFLFLFFLALCFWNYFQNIVSRWDGVPDPGPVWMGKHVLQYWVPVRTLGTRSLAVFIKRYSSQPCFIQFLFQFLWTEYGRYA